MYKANPNAWRLFAVCLSRGTAPFYFTEVKDCVEHQQRLNPLVTAGWVVSKRKSGERPRNYRVKREAYQRVMKLFADEIAEMEEEEKTMEEQRVPMPVPQDARVGRMIDDIWQNERKESTEMVAGW